MYHLIKKNKIILALALVFIILFFAWNNRLKEGFTWNQDTIKKFSDFEKTRNPNIIFDIPTIQQQASPEEVDTLVKTGQWPWSKAIRGFFKDRVEKDPINKIDPQDAERRARTIYNQTIMGEMLSWFEPEGQFLLNGAKVDPVLKDGGTSDSGEGTYGLTSGLIGSNKDIIKCYSEDLKGPYKMQRAHKAGYDGVNGAIQTVYSDVNDADLPGLVAGFSFLKGECNPCSALGSEPKYDCPFSLHDGKKGVSGIWAYLWKLDSGDDGKEFPILKGLKSELDSLQEIKKT